MNGKDNSLLKKLKAIPRPTAYASALPSTLELVTVAVKHFSTLGKGLPLQIPESLYEFWRRVEWLMLWFIDASGTIDLPSATDGDREECGIGGRSVWPVEGEGIYALFLDGHYTSYAMP